LTCDNVGATFSEPMAIHDTAKDSDLDAAYRAALPTDPRRAARKAALEAELAAQDAETFRFILRDVRRGTTRLDDGDYYEGVL